MATIDRSGQLAALVRAQLVALRTAGNGAGRIDPNGSATKEKPKSRSPDVGSASTPTLHASLDAWVKHRIGALSPDDPERRRKAFRIFLESVMRQEFGSQLIGEGGFDQLVDRVLQQMECDDDLRAAIAEATDALLLTTPSS